MRELIDKLNSRKPDLMGRENYFLSAVLIPLVKRKGNFEILFEVRSRDLARQPGEICFPGGRVENNEKKRPELAAVREAAEELGLPKKDIKVLTPLDFLVTPMGPVVYPFVGEILAPDSIVPNREEVERVFTVPVSFFLNYPPQVSKTYVATRYSEDFPLDRVPEVYRGGWKQRWSFPTYIYEYQEFFIWGMTATILHNFISMIKD
ncbi:8-oxo-dGTP pyrophosphatase MutT, NUDIX family [Desulfotomaculum arcticum]|uniref:8-oxo-dGTP pyrophosphatase MutT, NUDIX family n=1 Tax=Desulfotruncus arcticus DSM 17038 TaxID=1121424 RepID=A0A1I2XDQ2_9FIRM|nr:CoA pyrophosphatase [Desulfotruncus arcticus]SFH11595.1 8-oxo-dGTP pyrophosphatase MutT, NUDIX family [Desulfotomaculum arcticum] [Desulfotruncus arcticus DSM 17038]